MKFQLTEDGRIQMVVQTGDWTNSIHISTEDAQDLWAQLGRCLNKQNDEPDHLG